MQDESDQFRCFGCSDLIHLMTTYYFTLIELIRLQVSYCAPPLSKM